MIIIGFWSLRKFDAGKEEDRITRRSTRQRFNKRKKNIDENAQPEPKMPKNERVEAVKEVYVDPLIELASIATIWKEAEEYVPG